ncbi:MAG: FAD-dependent monooxygenase [Hyphomicrobiales bacterium]
MARPDSWIAWQGSDLPELPRWHAGNLVLTGDAAHATLPYLAQGAVMALEDAVVLARELGSVGSPPEAFARYEADRRPRTARASSPNPGRWAASIMPAREHPCSAMRRSRCLGRMPR